MDAFAVDYHIVSDYWMGYSLDRISRFVEVKTFAPSVTPGIFSRGVEYRSSSDYHTGAMVDAERFADCGRGVYVDTGLTVGALADHARYDRHAELHKLVGDTVVGYGLDAGIAVYHFLYGIGGRVASGM